MVLKNIFQSIFNQLVTSENIFENVLLFPKLSGFLSPWQVAFPPNP